MKVDVINVDDWCAIYVDGNRFDQGHSARADWLVDIMRISGIDADYRWIDVSSDDKNDLEFPETYAELPKFLRRSGE